jgi:hypothetical protein
MHPAIAGPLIALTLALALFGFLVLPIALGP